MKESIITGLTIGIVGGIILGLVNFLCRKLWNYLSKISKLENEIKVLNTKLDILNQVQPQINEILKNLSNKND